MSQKLWQAVDDYYAAMLLPPDPILDSVLADSEAAGLPSIQVSPLQGRMLMLLAAGMGARRILEVGTLGGYSSIWLARALPADGKLVTLEYEPLHAKVARANIEKAGFAQSVEVILGPAADSLEKMAGAEPFDFVFLDADKAGYPRYLELSLGLLRPDGLIVADNVVREGRVTDPHNNDEAVRGIRRFNELLAKDKRIQATAIQTVGEKGHDGFVVARFTG